MGEQIVKTGNEAVRRWQEKMPKFFRWLVYLCALISGTALAVNTAILAAGAQPHEWWTNLFPYLIGVPAGIAFASKFTVQGGFKEIDPNKVIQGNVMFDRDEQQPNMSDIETNQPNKD